MRKKNGIADTENIDSHNIFQFGSRKKIGISRRFSIKLNDSNIKHIFVDLVEIVAIKRVSYT